jgi:Icc-related predicted phosphoesterase
MGLRVLVFSDLHLTGQDEFDADLLEKNIASRTEKSQIDGFLSLGDVVDNIPRDREQKKSNIEDDIETGRNFFGGLGRISDRHGIPTYAVPGNHDYDIFEDIISHSDGSQIEGVYDARGANVFIQNEETYGLVGHGVESFDIGPEIDPEKYGIDDSAQLVENLYHVATVGDSIEQSADALDIAAEDYQDFYHDVRKFLDSFSNLEEAFETVYQEVDSDQTIFMSHIAPFGTKLDAKSIGREYSEHQGSMVNRTVLDRFMPGLALNGHHDYHDIDYFSSDENYGSTMYAVGIDEATPTEIVFDKGSVAIEQN